MLLSDRRRGTASCRYLFFFHDPPTTEIYTLSLHDALPISSREHDDLACPGSGPGCSVLGDYSRGPRRGKWPRCTGKDRKSTRLNSSHTVISYAVFCLKKKKKNTTQIK